MNLPPDSAVDLLETPESESAPSSPTRPFYWSVRRELWENRSIYLGPLAVAAVIVLGFLVSTVGLPERVRGLTQLALPLQYERVNGPFHAAAGLPVVAAFLVAVFYCLDALNGERRDRSILFWKSLPVSDRTTVLAKAAVPLVVLPAIVYPLVIVTHLIMLLVSSAVLAASGAGVALFWDRLPLFQLWIAFLYALVAIALWHAPVYAWLLLVSAWARRAAFLWAVLPLVAVAVFEAVAFRTSNFAHAVSHRLVGWFTLGFAPEVPDVSPGNPLTDLTPGRLLGSPGLWLGLLVTVVFLAAAVRLRRYREPL